MKNRYRKSDSFLEFSSREGGEKEVLSRVAHLQDLLDGLGLSPQRHEVIRNACRMFLSKNGPFRPRPFVIEEMRCVPDKDLPRYLWYRYRYDVYPHDRILDDYPPCLQIEPTSICNYRCVFCYQTDPHLTDPKGGHMGLMEVDLFRHLVDEATGKVEAVTLASRGEPLLHPKFEEMIRYAQGKFLALKVNTNAWYLDEAKTRAILEAGVNTLVFSADAASEPEYSRFRVRGNLARVAENIRRFAEIRRRDYPRVPIITRVSGVKFQDDQNLTEMEAFWKEWVDQVAFVEYCPWINPYGQPPSGVGDPCSDLWRRMFVWWNGTVNPCDVDYLSLLRVGNAREHALEDLWRSEGYEHLRAAHRNGRRAHCEPCGKCRVV